MMRITLKQAYSFYQLGLRDNQEDSRFPNADAPKNHQPFFVVCDGVGGHEKGEVASRSVCEAFGSYMNKVDFDREFSFDDFAKALDYAYNALHKAMRTGSKEMATTLTFICFHGGGALAAHIGDSRIYHIRPEVGILYRSDDHSLVNALVHLGNLTPEEAENHPQSNCITRCMDYAKLKEERMQATVIQISDIEPGDYFFLCTDGVLDKLDDERILKVFNSNLSDRGKCHCIAEMSKYSVDNNTAYLIPIKDVVVDDDEDSPEDMYFQESNKTVYLQTSEVSEEVLLLGNYSLKDKVSDYFKTIFK